MAPCGDANQYSILLSEKSRSLGLNDLCFSYRSGGESPSRDPTVHKDDYVLRGARQLTFDPFYRTYPQVSMIFSSSPFPESP